MNKQQLAAKIWESANKMRSKIDANDYKDYILGFIFYKYISEKEIKYLKANDWTDEYLPQLTEEDSDTVESIQKNLGYFISYENLFSTWLKKGNDFSVQDVRDALSAFSRLINPTHKKVFDGIFDTLQTGLSKLGDSAAAQSKAISDLIQLIKDIPMDGKQGYDVLGFIYEYLIEKFAENAGKKAGEFYTPHEVSLLMSEIVANHLKDEENIEIYDPTSGSGSLLINIGKSVAKYIDGENKVKYYAQELNQNTYNLTRMNLVMRGIKADNIATRNGDTLEDDWPYFDENDPIGTYDPLYVDAVVSNPPYSSPWNPADKETDPRYSGYGLAPRGKADYAFLLHDLYHLKPDGIMNIVLPHGVLFRGGEEGEIRRNLIEKNKIDAIIGLPANIFYGTGIPTIIIVLKQKRSNSDVLIIDASKGFIKEGKNNKLRASDIKRIVDVISKRENVDKFSRVVSRDEIRENEYNLNIPRYVNSSEGAESWDIFASMFGGIPKYEIEKLDKYWDAFPGLKTALFENTSPENCKVVTEDIKKTIKEHQDIKNFEDKFHKAFADFEKYLNDELISRMNSLSISRTEEKLAQNIFSRLKDIPLVDKYEAYQLLDDDWNKIAIDLEIIQTEGFESIKVVNPNIVVKKKGKIDQEVQEGWKGNIISFELVQNILLAEDRQKLREKENRLSDITSDYEEIFDMLTEEEKESDFVNEDSFVYAAVKKSLKSEIFDLETIEKLEKVIELNNEEKNLKLEIKRDSALIEKKSKETIENLTDEQVIELLKDKWIKPLIQNLLKLPDSIVSELTAKLDSLAKKYETTLSDIEKEIQETEKSLSSMIDDLVGDEFDMQGLNEFKKLLGGMQND